MARVQKIFDKSIGADREHYLKIDELAQHIDEAGRGIYDNGIGGKSGIHADKQAIVGADFLFTDLSASLIYYNNSGVWCPDKLQHLILKAFAHEPEADQAFFIPCYYYQPFNYPKLHTQ